MQTLPQEPAQTQRKKRSHIPIASNFSSTTGTTGDAKTAGASTIAGSYLADGEQSEKGVVNLHNNPDVPSSDAQGTLPDTDPIKLPIDPDTNHPE